MNACPYTTSDFRALDHAAWGFRKAEEALAREKAIWEALLRDDPLQHAREMVAVYDLRLAETVRRVRQECRNYFAAASEGERRFTKEVGIDPEKAIGRVQLDHLGQARAHLELVEAAA